jgi:lysophospholipase L1-like esterase
VNLEISHRSKIGFACFLVVIVVLVLAAMTEGIVRLRHGVKYGHMSTVTDMYKKDSRGFRVLKENTTHGNIKINSSGFRGPELMNPKHHSTVRLAFVGASTTFCAEVSSNELTWPHLVWRKLQGSKLDAEFDYVNAAVPGYTVKTSLKNLQYRLKSLQPDIVVIYHATNDLSYDTRVMAIHQGIYRISDREGDGILKYSLLWSLVRKNFKIMKRRKESINEIKLEYDPRKISKRFKVKLQKLVKESQEISKLVAIATFSYKIRREQAYEEQLQNANTALYYMPYMSIEGLLNGYEEYNRIIREVAKETGAMIIEGEMSIPGNDIYFRDSIHFTDSGSKLMAKRVSDALLNSADFEMIVQSKESKPFVLINTDKRDYLNRSHEAGSP